MTRVNFALLLLGLFLTVSAASDRSRADDENILVCQFVTVRFDYGIYIVLWSHFGH